MCLITRMLHLYFFESVTIVFAVFFNLAFLRSYDCQLVINVKNQGGDIVQETISSNTSADTITLEFQRPEGTLITQFIDFKSEVQIFRVLVLGEEERGQSQYQVLCFATQLSKNDFISADAMSKLRQRNPGAIRQPEEDRGKENLEMDLSIELDKSSVISPHLPYLCDEAAHSAYAREIDLRAWASPKALSRDIVTLTSSVKRAPPPKPVRCNVNNNLWQPCQCRLEICVGWYPCGLKYCHGKDSSGKTINYRCGIKTCRKCRAFDFFVQQKQQCLWDE
ncbi:out at first protein-like [Stegodyphus dumicola]|uniref:out at first protein-like n=1 Tax=Stegodyphus dumicola TaxID=202533 RepID=UPI0015AD7BF0|nr:out at first protein-like [Stegodyphus dumicola]XP_035224070.1 out at first protein-like [Stegodyphus dumicola]